LIGQHGNAEIEVAVEIDNGCNPMVRNWAPVVNIWGNEALPGRINRKDVQPGWISSLMTDGRVCRRR
jgi:hypothetical protein